MLDPSGMYPDGFHPIKINRSKDFKGTAARYDRTQHGRLCNPFHTDIYYLGNLIRERFIMVLLLNVDLIA